MSTSTFTLSSNDLGGSFSKDQIMDSMGCKGGNTSPHLRWENPPEGTQSFAITMHDPDAPTDSGFWHWAVFNIPSNILELKAGAGNPDNKLLPREAFMGRADTGNHQYDGPCPPEGDFVHAYVITVYALKEKKVPFKQDVPLAKAAFQLMNIELGRASVIAYYKR